MAITRIGLNQSINLASNITGTLPVANGGTALTSGFINGTSTPGKILQVKHDAHTGVASTTSSSYQDIPLEVSITPSSSSNKILCFVNLASIATSSSSTSAISVNIVRDSTEIAVTNNFGFGQTSGANYFTLGLHKEDSPSSTSALTYKVQFRNRESNTVTINSYNGNNSTLTVMEVAG
tara:strand:- start:210 stop:746 length:537 start_codon:yes stop_codon:yes gene_type:complete